MEDGKTGSTEQKHKSGRPNHAHTEENVTAVDELVLSRDDQTQTHRYTPDIQRDVSNTVQRHSDHSP